MGTASETAGTAQGVVDVGAAPHPEDLYTFHEVAQDQGALPSTEEELARARAAFDRDGLVVFSRGLEAEAGALREAVLALRNGTNVEFKEALLAGSERRGGAPPDYTNGDKDPWVQYEAGTPASGPLDPACVARMRKIMGFSAYSKTIRDRAVHHERLVAAVAACLGRSEAAPELFQDMALLKPSGGGREKPWHQDAAYFNMGADARVVGCWIALDAATPANGCLVFERGGHRRGELPHFAVRDYQLCDAAAPRREDVVACPLPPGGLVLFSGRIPHGTATNASDKPRNALQLHWAARETMALVPADAPGVGRVARFGGGARGLTC